MKGKGKAKRIEEGSPRKAAGSVGKSRPKLRRTTRQQSEIVDNDDAEIAGPPDIIFDATTRSTRADPSHLVTPSRTNWIDPESTCLSFGLCSAFANHMKVMCDKCKTYQGITLVTPDKKRSQKMACEQPWDNKFKNHNLASKRKRHTDFHQLFGHPICMIAAAGVVNQEGQRTRNYTPLSSNDTPQPPSPPSVSTTLNESTTPEVAVQTNVPISGRVPTTTNVDEFVDPTTWLFDGKLVLRKEATEQIINTLLGRDMGEHPLEDHELELLQILVVDGGMINKNVTKKILEPCLKGKKDGAALEEHELRLLGQLAYKQLKHEDRISLPSFPYHSKFDIVQVPNTRAARNFEQSNMTRLHRAHTEVAQKWMDHLPTSYNESLMISFMTNNKKKCKALIKKHSPRMFQVSPTDTIAIQTHAKLTDKQVEKIGRSIEYYAGLRMTASKDKVKALKDEQVEELTTFKQQKMNLQKKASAGNKKKKIFRDLPITVTEVRPLELVAITTRDNLKNGKYVKGSKRYKTNFEVDDKFKDTVMQKIGIDAGNGSTKAILNAVNVHDPQSQITMLRRQYSITMVKSKRILSLL